MQTLNNRKRTFTLTRKALIYIEKYQTIYKRVLREAKKKEIMIGMLQNQYRTKAMWRLINRQTGKAPKNE